MVYNSHHYDTPNKKATCHGSSSTYGVSAVNKPGRNKVQEQEGVQVHRVPEPQQKHQLRDVSHGSEALSGEGNPTPGQATSVMSR